MMILQTLMRESLAYDDRDSFVSDFALSSMWGDPEDAAVPASRTELLEKAWDATHRSVKEIAAAAGLSQRALARRFLIGYRTMEEWGRGNNRCPLYVRLMMQECLGLLPEEP